MLLLTLLTLLSAAGVHADPTRCDKVKAEAEEVRSQHPVSCDESRETRETYVKNLPEAIDLCLRLEQEASAPAKLKLGTEDEMQREAMEIRQKHLMERLELNDHVIKDLFPTPVDNNDPARPPVIVSSDCGTEIEKLTLFRKNLLRGISEFYNRIDRNDDTLLEQASERALPAEVAAPAKNVR